MAAEATEAGEPTTEDAVAALKVARAEDSMARFVNIFSFSEMSFINTTAIV